MHDNQVEIVVHIDESLSDTIQSNLASTLSGREGIYSAAFCRPRDHLMLINYDSQKLSSLEILGFISEQRVTAQLIGPI